MLQVEDLCLDFRQSVPWFTLADGSKPLWFKKEMRALYHATIVYFRLKWAKPLTRFCLTSSFRWYIDNNLLTELNSRTVGLPPMALRTTLHGSRDDCKKALLKTSRNRCVCSSLILIRLESASKWNSCLQSTPLWRCLSTAGCPFKQRNNLNEHDSDMQWKPSSKNNENRLFLIHGVKSFLVLATTQSSTLRFQGRGPNLNLDLTLRHIESCQLTLTSYSNEISVRSTDQTLPKNCTCN